jgi:hypothetical protein
MLFVPGNNPGMLKDAGLYGADSLMFDLEDAVAVTEKDSARCVTLGFTGSSFIKSTLGFSGTYTETQETVISSGATCPAWTAWYRRPYIRWYTDYWHGEEQFEYYDISTGYWTYEWIDRYGENDIDTLKADEYWSSTNTSHNPSISTPLPPSGAPR